LAEGGHGFGMAEHSKFAAVRGWTERLKDWLNDSGFLKSS
jgi:hypothetical protein